jgi:hypothetical protein
LLSHFLLHFSSLFSPHNNICSFLKGRWNSIDISAESSSSIIPQLHMRCCITPSVNITL